MRIFILALCLALGPVWASEGSRLYALDSKALTPKEIQATTYFLSLAESYLPKSMVEALGEKSLKVSFASKKSKSEIVLDKSFVSEFVALYETQKTQLPKESLRSLLRETFLAFDALRINLGKEKELFERCTAQVEKIKKEVPPTAPMGARESKFTTFCREVFAKRTSITSSPLFLDLTGRQLQGFFIQNRALRNKDASRTPDRLEMNSSSEAFLVNMDAFLADREFKCRRPSLYQYFSDVFSVKPHEYYSCKRAKSVATTFGNIDLDPLRIYQIHYLFAAKGKGMGSKWGHAMFRVVMCKPGRTLGPECLNDIAYHLVLSFRANVDDIKINNLKGMTGGYDSKLFLLTMKDVVNEYTKGEFRELQSIPLKFSREQLALFVERTLEVYYGYVGSYYFFTNNCATESMKLVQSANYENYEEQYEKIFTPLGMVDSLRKSGLADVSVLADRKLAIQKGYIFPGVDEILEKSFQALKEKYALSYENFLSFADESSLEERRELLESILERSGDERVSEIAKLLQLEDFILIHKSALFQKEMLEEVMRNADKGDLLAKRNTELGMEMMKLQAKLGGLEFSGYGIPQETDVLPVDKNQRDALLAKALSVQKELKDNLEKMFPEKTKLLNDISLFKKQISKSFMKR